MREAKRSNIQSETARLHAQNVEHTAESAINRQLKTKLPCGLSHRKVKALIDAINDARASLRAVGHEQQLFGSSIILGILVSKLKEESQARWYFYLIRFPDSREEEVFRAWLKIVGRAAKNWLFLRLLAAWKKGDN